MTDVEAPAQSPAASDGSRMSPATDPRIDRRLRAVMIQFGLGDLAPNPETTRTHGEQELMASVRASHEGFGGLYEALPNDLPGDVEVPFVVQRISATDDHQIVLRIYRPVGSPGSLPAVMYIHGGGMVILDAYAKVHHRWAQDIAAQGAVVISVEFRNAYTVEGLNPFPAGLDDCVAAVRWVHENKSELGITGLVLQGESGGANLSLATAIRAKREGLLDAIAGVYATVPYISGGYGTWSDERRESELPSLLENNGFFINVAALDLLVATYDPTGEHAEDPLCWPYFATIEDLAGLPPHVIVVNELDPLRDEGLAFYRKLLEAGVSVTGRINLGIVHGADMIFRQALPDIYFATVADIKRFADEVTSPR